MAQKTMCDFCKKNEADKNFKIMEKYQIWVPFYVDDWKHIDICNECYNKLFRIDINSSATGTELTEYKERVWKNFENIIPLVYICTMNDKFYFLKLVKDILDERYDDIELELQRYNHIANKDTKDMHR